MWVSYKTTVNDCCCCDKGLFNTSQSTIFTDLKLLCHANKHSNKRYLHINHTLTKRSGFIMNPLKYLNLKAQRTGYINGSLLVGAGAGAGPAQSRSPSKISAAVVGCRNTQAVYGLFWLRTILFLAHVSCTPPDWGLRIGRFQEGKWIVVSNLHHPGFLFIY